MARIDAEQQERLKAAVYAHDHLHRILRQIERKQRVVFHDVAGDWSLVRKASEQILIADLVTRYHADADRVYFALRNMETAGKTWDAAILELASAMQSYYTTPLGLMIRYELFGDDAIFVSPDARAWAAQQQRSSAASGAAG